MIPVKEIKGKKRLISNFTISHSWGSIHREGKEWTREAKMCYVRIIIRTKIQAFLKKKKRDKRKNTAQNYMKESRPNINFIINVNWLNWPIK